MLRTERFFLAALMCVGMVASLKAQAIVDATGADGAYTTINAALDANEAEIVVKNTGVYQESLLLTRDVILRGEDPNDPPVIAMLALPSQPALGTGDGIYIGGDGASADNLDITFKNFIVIPAISGGPADDAFSVTPNPGGVLTLTIENVLCAPNDGTDKPLTTDVWANPDLEAAGVVRIPDDGIYLMDDDFGGFAGDINATLTDFTFIGMTGDGFVLFPGENGNAAITATGLACSYCGHYAGQTDHPAPFTITGTQEKPGWLARKCGVGPIFFGAGDLQIDHMVSVDNSDCGVRLDADAVDQVTLTNSLFAGNFFQGVVIKTVPAAAKTWSISDTTFYNNDSGGNTIADLELTTDITADFTLNVNDCIFAGTEAEAIQNTNAVVNANNCAFVTEGPDALPAVSLGTPPIENNTVNADPEFVNTDTDPLLDTSFDVQSAEYATASTTDGPLNGWGDGPDAGVPDWSVY